MDRNNPKVLRTLNALAYTRQLANQLDLALALRWRILRVQRSSRGPGHIALVSAIHDLATVYHFPGRLSTRPRPCMSKPSRWPTRCPPPSAKCRRISVICTNRWP